MVGKRKRDTSVVSRSTAAEEEDNPPATSDAAAHDVFRRYFEAQFQPLELQGGPVSRDTESEEGVDDNKEDEAEGSGSGSEWGGISEPEDENNKVEVVEHKDSSSADDMVDKKARKAFMVCTTL